MLVDAVVNPLVAAGVFDSFHQVVELFVGTRHALLKFFPLILLLQQEHLVVLGYCPDLLFEGIHGEYMVQQLSDDGG